MLIFSNYKKTEYALNNKLIPFIVRLLILLSILATSLFIGVGTEQAYAINATDPGYAQKFLDENGNPEWYEDIITDLPGYNDKGQTPQSLANTLWGALFGIVGLILTLTLLFYGAKIAGRAIWIMAFAGAHSAKMPKFFQNSSERKTNGRSDFNNYTSTGFRQLFIDFLVGFGIAVGISVIFSVIMGMALFLFGLVPDQLQYFDAFGVSN